MLRSRISPSLSSILSRSTATVLYSTVFILTITSLPYMLSHATTVVRRVTEETLVFLVQQ